VREIRSLTQQVQTTTWHLDYESAILQGAARIMEVALQTAKDTAEEPYTIKLLEDSMLRVKEELKKVTP
jgi:inosine/xanthosine triphosphate pyrophosphatase family protein